MLNIYQEFVRNHQYSLQILAHCKQNRDFDKLLKQYEAKPDCEERTLETFLTYPMFQASSRPPHPHCSFINHTTLLHHCGSYRLG
jgi:Ras-specific guanine nucleotide-releasing factor 1